MRSLLVLVLLAALGAGAFLSKPPIDAHRANAEKVLAEQSRASGGDDIGDLIGAVLGQRKDNFEDLIVATKYTVIRGDRNLLECWGAFSQFVCSSPRRE